MTEKMFSHDGVCTKQNIFSYIWRTRFVGQGISAALQSFRQLYFIYIAVWSYIPSCKNLSFCHFDMNLDSNMEYFS